MSRTTLIAGLAALGFAAGPAFAQSAPPAQGAVQPHHAMHPAPAHKMPKMKAVHPDMSADQLNAKELASLQHGAAAMPAPMPATGMSAPAKSP
jgi:hypothetical protein